MAQEHPHTPHDHAESPRPAASIVVPSFQGGARLPVLLDAMRRQRFDGDWELIVVLDGVVDDSESVLAGAEDLPLRVVTFSENRGRSAALNAGFAAARGQVLIRCDDDLQPGPTYVADHVAAHTGPESIGAVGLYRNVLPDTPYAAVYGRWADEEVRRRAYAASLEERFYFWAGNCSVTAETFELVGPYDEDFSGYGWEDIDWGYRLFEAGIPVVLDPRLETAHHAANVTTEIRVRRAFQSGRAKARFETKHGIGVEVDRELNLLQRGWSFAVDTLAREQSLQRVTERGAKLDRLLAWLPRALGKRSVALLVEAAGRGGHRGSGGSI